MLRGIGRKNEQTAQAMVETAIMVLVIVLLIMGIIEFGFLFYAYIRVSNATREGARAGSLWLMYREFTGPPDYYYDPILCETVSEAVRSEFSAIPQSGMTITLEEGAVTCPDHSLAPQAGEPVTVTVTYEYPLPIFSAVPIIRDIIPSPFPISRTVIMRFQ
jgi:Flp pilus assembly protein TadG